MNGYSLQRACRIVREMDGSSGRITVFLDIVSKNSSIRLAHFLYDRAPVFIKAYLLVLYGLKCYLSANWLGPPKPDLAFLASMPNEKVAIAHVGRHLDGLKAGHVVLSRAHCFSPQSLRALPAFLWAVPRLRRMASRLVRRFHFLPACRVFSTTTYYLRFQGLLDSCGTNAVFIANHYSPECLALAAAAHRAGRKVVSVNHANGTWCTGYGPPLHSDLVVVTSQAVLDAYRRHSRRALNAVFVPQSLPQRPMRSRIDPAKPITVGIFLTALTSMERLRTLVAQLESNPMVARLLIRSHPVKAVNDDLSALTARGSRVVETSAIGLFENIGLCDIAICGNSTAAVDILRGGVPVLYDGALDSIAHDYNGYLQCGLVLPLPAALDPPALEAVDRFYGAPAWTANMGYFDAGYRQDERAMYRRLNDAVRAAVRAAPAFDVSLDPQRRIAGRHRPVAVS